MKEKKGKCPFSKLQCENCRLYRRGVRLVGIEEKQEEYGNCVFHAIQDNMEEIHRKVYGLQKEIGEVKNVMASPAPPIPAFPIRFKTPQPALLGGAGK